MSEDNLNINQMREDYPFLNKIWDLYDSFDKTVEGGSEKIYDSICKLATETLDNDKKKYYDICMKIVRNLDPHWENQLKSISHSIRCNNVNNWFYNSKDKINFSNKYIMNRIFNLSGSVSTGMQSYACSYYSYDENYVEPINIIRLRIFDDNMDIIRSTLMSKDQPNNTLCQKYVCECVNIYKDMNKLYCSESSAQHGKRKNTCEMLKALKNSYDMFLLVNPEIRKKIPSLEATDDDLLAICPSIQAEHSLQASVYGHSGSSTSKISTTIGTMAGVSSVFALLYKLTPAGRWINTGLRGSGGRINTSLYTNGQDELIFDGLDHNNFNSYNIGYEAA